jgi:cell division protease FtsH
MQRVTFLKPPDRSLPATLSCRAKRSSHDKEDAMQQASAHEIPNTAEPLARAYIDAVARAEGVKMSSMLKKHSEGADTIDAFLAELEGIPDSDAPHLRADLAATAILTARAVAAEAGLAGRLRRGDGPVVVIQTHLPDLVDPVSEIIKQCATSGDDRRKLIVARDGSERSHTPERGNADVVRALNAKWPVVGIAPDPRRHLPSSLLRMAEYRLALPALDDWTVRLLLEAITGSPYVGPIDADLVRIADMTDLSLSIRRDLTPAQCLERLTDVVRNKSKFIGDGPTLEELDGYGEAKSWGVELVADLKEYRAGRIKWSDVDRKGLLLSGPPGVGKTSFAKALARSADVPLIATSVADWNAASYLSGTLQAIRSVFAEAKRQAPAVLFIDELDGISNRANLTGDYVEYWSQIVNLLLECLAGVEDREGVVVLAATNHPDRIDPAILRAGRLDQHIELQKPDAHVLAKIFRFHVGPEVLPGADMMSAALAGRGGTGADVEAWVRRARASARRARRELCIDDLLDQIRAGRPAMTDEARRRVAVHEIGHAIVGTVLDTGRVIGASIHEHGGMTEFENVIDGTTTEKQASRHIAMILAGRVAERMIFGDIGIGSGSGPESDLARATRIAQLLETHYGFGGLGNVFIGDGHVDNLPRYPGLLEAIKARLDAAEECAISILSGRRDELEKIAGELERRGYLSSDDIEAMLLDDTVAAVAARAAAE